uniref:Uncharacterized protein n=1 Tax=Trichogramma kaykai TaxID=54128 RepID=A0ABD2XGR4_9HYME
MKVKASSLSCGTLRTIAARSGASRAAVTAVAAVGSLLFSHYALCKRRCANETQVTSSYIHGRDNKRKYECKYHYIWRVPIWVRDNRKRGGKEEERKNKKRLDPRSGKRKFKYCTVCTVDYYFKRLMGAGWWPRSFFIEKFCRKSAHI